MAELTIDDIIMTPKEIQAFEKLKSDFFLTIKRKIMTEEIKRYFYGDSRKKLQENTYTDGKLTKIEKWYESGQILNKMN